MIKMFLNAAIISQSLLLFLFGCTQTTSAPNPFIHKPVAFKRMNNFLFTANTDDNSVSTCQINVDGSLGSCSGSQGNSTFFELSGLALNPKSNTAYLINHPEHNFTTPLSICPINSDGSLGICVPSDGGGKLSGISSITINSLGTIAYFVNSGTQKAASTAVTTCQIQANGQLTNCNLNMGFKNPGALALNEKNSEVYILNGNGKIFLCPTNSTTGIFSGCSAQAFGGTNSIPMLIRINNSNTYLYVFDMKNRSIAQCAIDSSGTLQLTACTNFVQGNTNTPGFDNITDIKFSANDNFAYLIDSQKSTVWQCVLSSGQIQSCSAFQDPTFGAILSFEFSHNYKSSYILSYEGNSAISVCQITSTGALSSCKGI